VVFQRTPSSVDLRGNKPSDPEWWASLKDQPGWQRARRDNFGAVLTGIPVEEDLVADGWTDVSRRLRSMMFNRELTPEQMAELAEIADFEKMEEIRQRVEETVTAEEVAEALKPYYRQFCKRPTFNDEFLPCFNQDNVTLIDVSETKGVERINATGIYTGGKQYDVDCIIYASGFEITTRFERRIGFAINGRDGVSLYDHWRNGMKTLHGFSTRGFPNWFYIGGSQNAFSANMTHMFDSQAQHIAYIIAETQRRGGTTVEPSREGEDAWVAHFTGMQLGNQDFQIACTPGYYNNEGEPKGSLAGGIYLPGINHFNQVLEEWRAEGSMAGLELDRA
jgi:cyclohexanone monooxygenase